MPGYRTTALVGGYIAISTKQDASIGITLSIPIAMLMVQLGCAEVVYQYLFPE